MFYNREKIKKEMLGIIGEDYNTFYQKISSMLNDIRDYEIILKEKVDALKSNGCNSYSIRKDILGDIINRLGISSGLNNYTEQTSTLSSNIIKRSYAKEEKSPTEIEDLLKGNEKDGFIGWYINTVVDKTISSKIDEIINKKMSEFNFKYNNAVKNIESECFLDHVVERLKNKQLYKG